MQVQEKAKKLLDEMNTIFFATLTEEGLPNVRAMTVSKTKDLGTVWLISGIGETKSRELAKNPCCMIYAATLQENTDYIELRLWGTAQLLTDKKTRQTVWHETYNNYFKGIDDPNLQVIKFTAQKGIIITPQGTASFSL